MNFEKNGLILYGFSNKFVKHLTEGMAQQQQPAEAKQSGTFYKFIVKFTPIWYVKYKHMHSHSETIIPTISAKQTNSKIRNQFDGGLVSQMIVGVECECIYLYFTNQIDLNLTI